MVPIQYPIFRSVISAPATESAVQTTPPITRAATMPPLPFNPQAASTIAVMISVMMVMPLTGLVPTMAIALAATVVKRKAITATISSPTRACQTVFTTPPKAKNAKTASSATEMPNTTVRIERSSSVRSGLACAPPLRENSLTAMPTADLITLDDLMMPMMPAVAMPPIPI